MTLSYTADAHPRKGEFCKAVVVHPEGVRQFSLLYPLDENAEELKMIRGKAPVLALLSELDKDFMKIISVEENDNAHVRCSKFTPQQLCMYLRLHTVLSADKDDKANKEGKIISVKKQIVVANKCSKRHTENRPGYGITKEACHCFFQ